MTAEQQLELAKKHLLRVKEAWDLPRWDDPSLYGFYCLENAVTAAATQAKITFKKTHPGKLDAGGVQPTAIRFLHSLAPR